MSWIDEFQEVLNFKLDEFQVEALESINRDENLLVAAPTGAGKTIIGDAAIYYNLKKSTDNSVYYTTPIKALSNQKYNEMCKSFGSENVGLITGDVVINRNAPVIIMTTEVLRNMLYSTTADDLNVKCVILDEVHFLGDKVRGSVWEEVIIHLPLKCNIISLSATVSNLEEFGGWLGKVRGNCKVILTEKRPVPLKQLVALGGSKKWSVDILRLYKNGRLNSELVHRMSTQMMKDNSFRQKRRGVVRYSAAKSSVKLPSRTGVIEKLKNMDILPCIFFIFSRKGCDDAVNAMIRSGMVLTTSEERLQIEDYIENKVKKRIDKSDYTVLGFSKWKEALGKGFAAHHAGFIPVFKEAVEYLFEHGIIKVVFATETLALGVNMPARSVVIEKLSKYDGTGRIKLTPGQFTQLTGRAGRRGLDNIGYAVVLNDYGLRPRDISSLASTRVYPLISSFMPGYNMALNLVYKSDMEYAKGVLLKSFAQYQLDQKLNKLKEHTNRNSKTSKAVESQLVEGNVIASRFEKLLAVLKKFNYVDGGPSVYELTDKGNALRNLYCEHVLVLTECIERGIFLELNPIEFVSILSCFISVSRGSQLHSLHSKKIPGGENSKLFKSLTRLLDVYKQIYQVEIREKIRAKSDEVELNFALIAPIFDFANNASLETIISSDTKNISLGDFVRCAKGIIDILLQMRYYCDGDIKKLANQSIDLLDHGIVSLFME
ncbi:MAG: DEAD/DEAH box helicase [Candidatus Ancillula sp.]|jgi:ATP-dependent RNA helicase HelY|nr:DEAD/DEAH box helicase [Candidatus Ancillula sp.]